MCLSSTLVWNVFFFFLLIDMITGLQATPTGIEWTTPSGVPVSCFPQYIISLTADPTVTLTVNDTTASSAALNAAGFPYCVIISAGEHGTLFQLRNKLGRSNVITDPTKDFNACDDFFQVVVSAHIIAAAMKLLKMKSVNDVPTPVRRSQ